MRVTILLAAALVAAACGGGSGGLAVTPIDLPPTGDPGGRPAPPSGPPPAPGPAPSDPLAGGVVATFRAQGTGPDGQPFDETYRIWVTNPKTIDDLFALQAGTIAATIPGGAIHRGQGQAGHNAPWSWHIDPEDVQLVEVAAEVCDGRPSIVENLLDAYLTAGRFCPWSVALDSIDDRR